MVGTRAACREEILYAENQGIDYISSYEINNKSLEDIALRINKLLEDQDAIYLSIDLDVLDPAFAPAVQTPEPEGISTLQFLEILSKIDLKDTVAFDIVEVAPKYDSGVTSIVAAKVIFEVLNNMSRSKS